MDYLANGIPERPARFIKHYKIIITRRNLRRNSSRGGSAQLKPAPRFTMRKEDDRGFESRILALIDGMVDHASDDGCLPVGICVAT